MFLFPPDILKYMQSEDQKLVKELLSRNEAALNRFYHTYAPQLLGFIRAKVGIEADVEEIAQDTLFALLEGLRDFTFQSSLKTYLFSIAHHKIVDFYRKKKLKKIVFSQIASGLELIRAEGVEPEELFTRQMITEKITTILKQLAPRYGQILVLKYVEGRNVVEIAGRMSLSFKSAESLLFRARKAFVKLYNAP